MGMYQTIAGIATPLGEGGISIIRISGREAMAIAKKVFESKQKNHQFKSRYMYLGTIIDGTEVLDEVLLVFMGHPKTYTGEDVVEIHCHGGILITKRILELILRKGARLAEAGEFTKRAFLNGKLDLSQAEAVIDLIAAKSDLELKNAIGQLQGKLTEKVNSTLEQIELLLANIEAEIDFPDDELDVLSKDEMSKIVDECQKNLMKLLQTFEKGRIVKEGVNTVIIGRPNVGKSSLLNALLREEKAIVTAIPGTTRDIVEDIILIKGVPLRVIDTAGFRKTEDIVEIKGIEKTEQKLSGADLVLMVVDASERLTKDDYALFEKVKLYDKKMLVLVNKVDVKDLKLEMDILRKIVERDNKIIEVSALEQSGIDKLEEAIVDLIFKGELNVKQDIYLSRTRHKDSLQRAWQSLNNIKKTMEAGLSEEFISIDLKDAWNALAEVTGDVAEQDILDKIFSEFCIGK